MLEAMTPPIAPSGRTSRIEIGMGQLSYRAARKRKMTRMEKQYKGSVCALACLSWYDRPVQS